MKRIRTIARLDIKGENLIKSISLEGLRVVGSPSKAARKYYLNGADELIYIDLVASLYGRSKMDHILKEATKDIFIPLTVGGGIRTIEDVEEMLLSGADKIAINTAAVSNPNLIKKVATKYGRQCMVLSIEAKKTKNTWEVCTECGRESSGIDVIDWAKEGQVLGAGEILLTSIDREGTRKGFDVDLIKAVANEVKIPIIASGGFGDFNHLDSAINSGADAISIASCLHYNEMEIIDIKSYLESRNYIISKNI